MIGTLIRDCFKQFWSKFERFTIKNLRDFESCSKSVQKCSFYKLVKVLPEIDWHHYQGTSPAPTCIVRHQTLIKAPTSEVSHQCPVCEGGQICPLHFQMLIPMEPKVHLGDHKGPLRPPIPEFSTTMDKTVFREFLEAVILVLFVVQEGSI